MKSEIQDPSRNATHRLFVTFHLFFKTPYAMSEPEENFLQISREKVHCIFPHTATSHFLGGISVDLSGLKSSGLK